MKRHVLISPLGRSPGAVSGVYFGLEDLGVKVDEVITVGTADAGVKKAGTVQLRSLFGEEGGVVYRPRFMADEELRGGEDDISPFAARMGLYIEQARDDGSVIHVAVTGGRSGMGALAALAAQLYGADHIWHLWVAPEIEKGGTVDKLRFPYSRRNLYLNPTVEKGKEGEALWELVELPLVDLTWLHGPIREYVQTGAVSDAGALPRDVPADEGAGESSDDRSKYLVALRKFLMAHFNLSELQTLCFDMGIDYDVMPGPGKTDKVRELVGYLDRRDRVLELAKEVKERRPDVLWPDDLRTAPPRELPLLYTFVQASRSALAQIFPAGLTTAAKDRIVTLTPKIRRGSDEEMERALETLIKTLQNAGIYDLDGAQCLDELGRQKATLARMQDLVSSARNEDDQGFFRWLSSWLPEAEEMSAAEMTVGQCLVEALGDWPGGLNEGAS